MSALRNRHNNMLTNTLRALIIIFPIMMIYKCSTRLLRCFLCNIWPVADATNNTVCNHTALNTGPRCELPKPTVIYHHDETFLQRCREREESHSWLSVRNLVTLRTWQKAAASPHTTSASRPAFPSYESDSYKNLLSRSLVTLSDFQNPDMEQSNSFNSSQ